MLTWRATGRAGECGVSTFRTATYDYDHEMLRVLWPNKKIGTQEPMLFAGHLTSYLLNVDFAFAVYWCFGPPNSQWMVEPLYLRSDSAGVADELTRQIHRAAKSIEGLPDDATVKGIRSACAICRN